MAADPTFTRAHPARAHALKRLGRLEEALAAIDGVLGSEPRNAIALAAKGSVLQEMKKSEEGGKAFEQALAAASDRDKAIVHYNYACYWAIRRDAEKCREHLRQALLLDPVKKSVAAVDRDFQVFARTAWFQNLVAFTR